MSDIYLPSNMLPSGDYFYIGKKPYRKTIRFSEPKPLSDLDKIKEETDNYFNESVNYVHVEPDSQFFTDIKQILEGMKYYEHNEKYFQYLKKGLENTLKQGYNIQPIDKDENSNFEEWKEE